jgi:hypothetical protein
MAIFAISCNDESQLLTDSTQSVDIETADINTKVSAEEAEQHVLTMLNDMDNASVMNGGISARRGPNSNNNRKIRNVQAVRVGNKGNIRKFKKEIGLAESIDTLMYIVNFEDNQGYAIVAADNRTENVYAIIDQGMLSADSLEYYDNPGLNVFMEDAAVKILTDMKKNFRKPKKNNPVTYATTVPAGAANIYLKTRWSQGAPYNQYCPLDGGKRCPTGCTVTAVAQLVAHFETINSVQWSYNGSSGGATLNWDRIKSDCTSNQGKLPVTSVSAIEVAHLMRHLGLAMDADYSANGTGVDSSKGVNWMNNWGGLSATGLSSYNTGTISSVIIANTTFPPDPQNRKLVYIRAYAKKKTFLGITTGYTDGHVWIIDGQYIPKMGTTYFHCNFGWGGQADGFYLTDVFDTTVGPEYIMGDDPDPATTSSYNFKYQKKISIVGL